MELIVDDRERKVINHFESVKIQVRRITTGDYVFMHIDKIIAVIERKTLADLASSIKDGRMSNNDKLIECRTHTKCHIIYIIEGRAYPGLDRKIGRIKYRDLQTEIDNLMFIHDVKVIWTRDPAHTARRLEGLFKTFQGMVPCDVPDIIEGGGMEHITKRWVVGVDIIRINMIKSLPGVSFSHSTCCISDI